MQSDLETSGIRIGVPAITTRGLTQQDVKTLTRYISNLINACKEDYESDFDLLDKFLYINEASASTIITGIINTKINNIIFNISEFMNFL